MLCFTGAAQSEAIEIYERVNLSVTLRCQTQQVVILFCPPRQRQVLPSTGDRSLLTLDNGGKQGNKKVQFMHGHFQSIPALRQTYKCIKSPLYEHKKSIFQCKHRHAHSNCQCFSLRWETEASEDNSSVTHSWAWHRQTGRDPLCIEGYSWLQLKEGKKNGDRGEGWHGGGIIWPRASTTNISNNKKYIRREQNFPVPGSRCDNLRSENCIFFTLLSSTCTRRLFFSTFTMHSRMKGCRQLRMFLSPSKIWLSGVTARCALSRIWK